MVPNFRVYSATLPLPISYTRKPERSFQIRNCQHQITVFSHDHARSPHFFPAYRAQCTAFFHPEDWPKTLHVLSKCFTTEPYANSVWIGLEAPRPPHLFWTQCLRFHPLSALLSHLNPSTLLQYESLPQRQPCPPKLSRSICLLQQKPRVLTAQPSPMVSCLGAVLRDNIAVRDLTQKGRCWAMICRMATGQSWFFFFLRNSFLHSEA